MTRFPLLGVKRVLGLQQEVLLKMCDNIDHNQYQFSANGTILLGFGHRS